MERPRPPPLKSSDSTVSLGSARHPLVWLFNHFRQEGKTSLCKEDLQRLVGPQVDTVQLDQAFDNLDADGDGKVTMDEFISGFARFWRETPDTPSHKKYDFNFSPSHSLSSSGGGSLITARKRLPSEEHYEYGGEENPEEGGPDKLFQRTLCVLSSHNRHSMEQLWRSLKEANPELLTDFEDFVSEVASEVEGAQRALDNQRRANKKEAMELDTEIESRLSAAQTTLHIQTSLVRQEEKLKLERRLVGKESELFSVRNDLQMLESEIIETQQNRLELEQDCQDLRKEKQELKERLEVSERKLQQSQTQTEAETLDDQGTKIEQLNVQQKLQSHQEEDLLRQKKSYEEEILKLRNELELYGRQGAETAEDKEVESLLKTGVARPDLLATTHSYYGQTDTGSLMQEIAAKEGLSSPLLRKEQVLLPGLFQRTRAGSMRKRTAPITNHKSRAVRSLSLPNLADVDSLESLEVDPPAPSYRLSVIPPQQQQLPSSSASSLVEPTIPKESHTSIPISPQQGAETQELRTRAQDWQGEEANCKALEFIETLPGKPDYIFKVLVVGNSYVGKSSYLMQLCNRSFSQRYSSTIGVDFYTKALKIDDKLISLQLWDTAGQERFQSVTKAYYRGAQGVVLVYDLTQEESFIAVKSWINSIQENSEDSPAAMCLVGNKQDLDAEREVSVETGETFAKIYGAEFIETSAKTGYNVGNSLLKLVRSLKTYYENSSTVSKKERETVQVATEDTKPSETKCCGR